MTLVDFEHIVSINVDSLADKKVLYLYREVFHQVTIQLGHVQSRSYLTED